MRRLPGVVLGAGMLVGAAGCGAGVTGEGQAGAAAVGSERGIHTIAMVVPPGSTSAESAETTALRALVESLSMGRIAVDIDSDGGRCGNPVQCLSALRTGKIDVYMATAPDAGRLFPAVHVLDVPYLLESDEVVDRVFRGAFFARLRDALLHGTGLRLMALGSAGGWRAIATSGRVVRTPADMDGLTLRTAESPVEIEWARSLGATASQAAWSELPAALASGRIGGAADGITEIVGRNLHEGFRYLTRDRHGYRAALWLMNDAAYRALPADLQPVLRAGFDELARLTLARARAREAEAIAAFEAAGGEVYTPTVFERRAFVMAAGRVSTWYMEEHGYEWLVWLEGSIAEAEREIALADAREKRLQP